MAIRALTIQEFDRFRSARVTLARLTDQLSSGSPMTRAASSVRSLTTGFSSIGHS
jgi:hypothetical protein